MIVAPLQLNDTELAEVQDLASIPSRHEIVFAQGSQLHKIYYMHTKMF